MNLRRQLPIIAPTGPVLQNTKGTTLLAVSPAGTLVDGAGAALGAGGGIQSIVAGTGIIVDATDPANPVVNASVLLATKTLLPADILALPATVVAGVQGYHIMPVSIGARWSAGEVFYDSAAGLYLGYGGGTLFPAESIAADFLTDPSYFALAPLQKFNSPGVANAGGDDLQLYQFETVNQRTNGIRTVVIHTAGVDYQVGDRFGVTGGNGDCEVYVTSVSGSGGVTGTKIWTGGSGYSNANNQSTSADFGAGSGLTVDITVGASNGSLTITTLYHLIPQIKTKT